MTYKNIPVLLALLFSVLMGVKAQELRDFTFSHLGTADGMHTQRVYSILQTSDGALWWSTKNGVERYNGVNIKHYLLGDVDVYSDYAGKRINLCNHFGKDVKCLILNKTNCIQLLQSLKNVIVEVVNMLQSDGEANGGVIDVHCSALAA